MSKFENNRPVADFFCTSCNEEYELKSQKSKFGTKVLDGAFRAMCDRLAASNNPNLMLLKYDRKQLEVTDLFVVPKHFFVREIIEERKPLASTARRAGWVGCNILLDQIPKSGKVFLVRGGEPQPKDTVLSQWQRTLFLREEGVEARGWLIEVMKCVEDIGKHEFQLEDVYAFEAVLSRLYPENRHVRQKISTAASGTPRLRISRLRFSWILQATVAPMNIGDSLRTEFCHRPACRGAL